MFYILFFAEDENGREREKERVRGCEKHIFWGIIFIMKNHRLLFFLMLMAE